MRTALSAQKETHLARRRGGGASARFGGREGVGIPRQKLPAGRALSRCISERTGKSPPEWRWLRLVGDMALRCRGVADTARNDGAAGRYHTAGNGSAVPSDHFGVSSRA